MTDQRTLNQVRDELRAACAALVDPQPAEVVDDETGVVSVHDVEPLLQQLLDATGNGSGRPGGPSKSRPIPVNLDAMALRDDIDAQTATWNTAEADIEARIRVGVNVAGGWTSIEDVSWVLAHLKRWAEQIDDLLHPKRRLSLAAPCPACGKSMTWRKDESTGETVQVPALHLEQVGEPPHRQWECVCQNPACRHRWPTGTLEHLAMVVDQERTERRRSPGGEPLALWADGSVHRLSSNLSNMALPFEQRLPNGGSAA